MISDVLFEAREDLQRYLDNYAETYADIRPRVERLMREMADLQRALDTPPLDLLQPPAAGNAEPKAEKRKPRWS